MVWVASLITKFIGPWKITVHQRHGNAPHVKRHVHITRKGVRGEYSWNVDGTPHDHHRFPDCLTQVEVAKEYAARALKIDQNILTYLFSVGPKSLVSIRTLGEHGGTTGPRYSIYVRITETLYLFTDGEGIHCVCTDA
jgi:Family of unknown function (DUF6367)